MMKMKYFMLATAALAFAACSNNDTPQEDGLGELLPSVSVTISDSHPASTRAMSGTASEGIGTENGIYHAFVFAKEASPSHANALAGDWTVKELGSLGAATPLAQVTTSFSNVRQGDHVYVIANHSTMTLTDAESFAHNGTDSEARIKALVSQAGKAYVNSLTWARYAAGGAANTPSGQFLMAGVAQLPLTTIPNGGTVKINVPVDRELAKVNFTAKVSDLDVDIAKGNVEIQAGDGIVIVRVPRSVSPFTTPRTDGAYIPMPYVASVMDWPNDKGELKDVTLPAFNATEPAITVGEYRYAYALAAGDMGLDISAAGGKTIFTNSDANPTLFAPIFYVTPNYSTESNAVTAIAVQATYVGVDGYVSNGVTYNTGDKLFYRVDIADYINGVSQKYTERNVTYTTRGTIRSLGAKNIYDATTAEGNTMEVTVTVNPWKVSINEVSM